MIGLLSGCGQKGESVSAEEPEFRVVCTVFPLYDWTSEILGGQEGRVELTMLLKDGSDLFPAGRRVCGRYGRNGRRRACS